MALRMDYEFALHLRLSDLGLYVHRMLHRRDRMNESRLAYKVTNRATISCLHPISISDSKPKPWNYPSLAPLDVEVDKQLQFPELLLAVATVYRTVATAHLLSEVEMGM
jgi:hypothetical protein